MEMNSRYIEGFDILRGIFIILIFLSHSADFNSIGSESIWGAAGVTGFFILSGFLSNYKYSKSGDIVSECVCAFAKFMVKFYPLYICITLLWCFIKPWSGVI